MKGRRVTIAGAGIAGLAAAWWLARGGWTVTIVERARDLRAGGYMLGLSGPGYEVAARMGLLPRLEALSRDVQENVFVDRHGREVLRLSYRELMAELSWLTVTRTELASALADAVAGSAEIRFSTTISDFSDDGEGVDVTLSDGSTLRADLLIGADGIHSALRQRLFGDEARFAVHLGYRVAAFDAPDTLSLGGTFLSFVEPGRICEIYRLDADRLATLYIWRSAAVDAVPAGERRSVLSAAFRNTHPDATALIEAMPDDVAPFLDTMTLIEMPSWSKGRVMLMGDAAHCLTLVSGQGAGMAMASACILAEELALAGVPTALARHEARLRPVITGLQARSRATAKWFVPNTRFGFALRNVVMSRMPRRLLNWYVLRGIRSEILSAGRPLSGAAD